MDELLMKLAPAHNLQELEVLKGAIIAKALSLAGTAVAALVIFVVGRLLARVLARTLSRMLERSGTDRTLVKFLDNLVYALLLVFVVAAAVEKLGVNTTSFIGIIAAAGLAIGLALQGSLSNFAAGVMIILLKHFAIDDRIEAAGQTGRVADIHIFSSVIVNDDNVRIILPNGAITAGPIKVFPKAAEKAAAAKETSG